MTGTQALLTLETLGYSFSLQPDGKIRAVKPANPPSDAQQLMNDLKADKPAAVHLLQQRAQGASVAVMEDQTTKSTNYADIKPLKFAQAAGEIEVKRVIYHRSTGIIEAIWRPLVPLPFLDLDKYRQMNLPPDGG
jgi:hypothetical protein